MVGQVSFCAHASALSQPRIRAVGSKPYFISRAGFLQKLVARVDLGSARKWLNRGPSHVQFAFLDHPIRRCAGASESD